MTGFGKKDRPSFRDNLAQLYHGPVRNEDFSLARALGFGAVEGTLYAVLFYWVTLILDGSEAGAWAVCAVGLVAGWVLGVVFDRWKFGFAMGSQVHMAAIVPIFAVAFYLLA